jgi:hypothetical protein
VRGGESRNSVSLFTSSRRLAYSRDLFRNSMEKPMGQLHYSVHVRTWFLAHLPLVSLVSVTLALFANPQSNTADYPRDPADILLIAGNAAHNGIYLLDSSARAVYFYPYSARAGETGAIVPLEDFTPFATIPDVRRPAALAYHEGKLYVLDPETAMLKWIGIDDRGIGDLKTEEVLRKPTAIAVSDSGEIAVADGRIHSILRISTKGERSLRQYSGLDEPARMVYDHSNLLILDKRGRGRLHYDSADHAGKLAAGPHTDINMHDFAFQRGVLYLAAPDQVAVYAPDTQLLKIDIRPSASSANPNPPASLGYPDRVAASEDALAALCRAQGNVRIWPRPVPVQATLEGTQSSNNRALARLYEYLDDRRLLPTYKVRAKRIGTSFQMLLLDQWILLPPSPTGSAARQKLEMDPDSQKRFQKIVCRDNASLCSAAAGPAKMLRHNLWPGEIVTLPEVYVSDASSRQGRKPDEATGRDTPPRPAPAAPPISQPYSLGAELERRGNYFPALPPNPEIRPGSTVQLDNGRVRFTDRLSSCWNAPKSPLASEPVSLAPNLILPIAAESMPSVVTRDTALRDPKKMGVLGIVATFEGVQRQAVDADAILKSQPATGKCLSELAADRKTGLVSDVLVAASAKYRVRTASSFLTPAAIKTLETQLAGRKVSLALLSDGIELKVRQPLVLAFTVVSAHDAASSAKTPAPLNPRDIAGWNTPLWRPSVATSKAGWLLSFLVPAREVNDLSSGLRKLEAENDDMYIWSAEEQPTSAQSTGGAEPESVVVGQARAGRRALMSRIGYPPVRPDLSRSAVGILENASSVNARHVAFCAGPQSLWIQGLGGSPDPCESDAAPPDDAFGLAQSSDHGTHVAGILSTLPGCAVEGLLANARLGLIDTSRINTLEAQMRKAIDEQVIVFNFSGSILKGAETSWVPVKKKLKKDWQDRLMVVAAGNDGADLSLAADAPVQWVKDAPWNQNMIAVGAADALKHMLSQWSDEQGTPHTGSNWGREYVQLLADGKDVVSTIDGHSYGIDTGTSMAAPQVAAAAVLLEAAGVREPNRIKARLISTADWDPAYEGFVSGGYLNVQMAAWMPSKTLLATQSEPTVQRFVNDLKTPGLNDRISVEEGTCQRIDSAPCDVPASLRFESILRIRRVVGDENRFRVWFVDPLFKQLTVLDGVLLTGMLQFSGSQVWDIEQKKLVELDKDAVALAVAQISDYVASESCIPRNVSF